MARDPSATAGTYQAEGYDVANPFAQILRGEIEMEPVYEDEYALAFHDREPKARFHVIVIPKGQYQSLEQFVRVATPAMVAAFWRAVSEVTRRLGFDRTGFRVILNEGPDAQQEVSHLHAHVLGGQDLGDQGVGVSFGPARGLRSVEDPARSLHTQPQRRGFGRSEPEAREQRRGPPPP